MTVHEPEIQTRADAAREAQLTQSHQFAWYYSPPLNQPGVGPWHLVGGGRHFSAVARSTPSSGFVVNQFGTVRPTTGVGPVRGFSEGGFRIDFRAPASGFYLVQALVRVTSVTNIPGGGVCRTTGLLGVRGADGYLEDLPALPVGNGLGHWARMSLLARLNGGATSRITVGSAIEIIRKYYSPDFWRTYGEVIGTVEQLAIFRVAFPEGAESEDLAEPAAGPAPEDDAERRSDDADYDPAEVLRQRTAELLALAGDA